MAFSESDIKDVFFQLAKKRCQCCNKNLNYNNRVQGQQGAWHAHHIKPRREGINDRKSNIAILCINTENCHIKCAHGGNTRTHNKPQDYGKPHIKTRRCLKKTTTGSQCRNSAKLESNKRYCETHSKKKK